MKFSSEDSTILIVDDLVDMRDIMQDLLQTQGYQLLFASSGNEALEYARMYTPDLILLDVMMPDLNGFAVCRQLREDPALNAVPIILITALDDRASKIQGIEAGADDFISKPFDSIELRTRIATILRLNRYRRLLNEQSRVAAEQARFTWVVEHADDGFLTIDADWSIRYANAQARSYLSLGDGPLPDSLSFVALVRQLYHLAPPEVWANWPLPNNDSPCYLVRAETATEPDMWLRVDTARPSLNQPEWVVRMTDVTHEISAQRSVWAFHSVVAHKLRTPMSSTLCGLEILTQHRLMPDHDSGELLQVVLNSARRLSASIEDVLSYIDLTSMRNTGTPCGLAELQPIIEQLAGEAELTQVNVQCEIDRYHATLPLARTTVELILRELLENTRKFHPQHTPNVEVTITADQCYVCIRIADDGRAISKDKLTRVWEPYYQSEKHFTGQIQGMGLGLPTVARLVWGVGGTCRLINRTPGPGIVVELFIPFQ